MRYKTYSFVFYWLASVVSLSLFAGGTVSADYLPLAPRISANGYASDYAVGQGDSMLPLVGNNTQHFYLNPSIAYGSDQQGYADLGLGYRWVQSRAAILG